MTLGAAFEPHQARSSRSVILVCVCASLLALSVPVLLVRMPPVTDYPNHFSRLWLVMGGAQLPVMSAIYAVDWSGASTNIGIDVLAALFAPILPVEILGRALLILSLALPPLGAVLLSRAVFATWHPWQAGFALLAWNWTMLAGFLNFQMALGLALMFAAADGALERKGRWVLIAARLAGATVLLIVHPFGLMFYAGLLAALVFGPDFANCQTGPARRALLVRGTAAVLTPAVPAVLLLLLAPAVPGTDAIAGHHNGWTGVSMGFHPRVSLSAIGTYRATIDVVVMGLFFVPVVWAWWRGRLGGHAGLLLMAAVLAVGAPFVPSAIGGAYWVHARFPLMALLAGVAGLYPALAPAGRRPLAAGLAVALLGLALGRTAWITSVWEDRQADVAALERALAMVPEGAAVLPMANWPVRTDRAPLGRFLSPVLPTFWHLAVLAVPERHAFVPTLFAARGLQPMRVLAPRSDLADPQAFVHPPQALLRADSDPTLPTMFRQWRQRFDYALLVNADMEDANGPPPSIAGLEAVADEGFARLYRISRVP